MLPLRAVADTGRKSSHLNGMLTTEYLVPRVAAYSASNTGKMSASHPRAVG